MARGRDARTMKAAFIRRAGSRLIGCMLLTGAAFFACAAGETVYSPQVRVEAVPQAVEAPPAPAGESILRHAQPAKDWRPEALLETVDRASGTAQGVAVYRYALALTGHDGETQTRWHEIASLPLQRDAAGWYVHGRGAFTPFQDDFFNRVGPHDAATDVWGWHAVGEDEARAFSVRDDRWYFDGATAEDLQGGMIAMRYLLPFEAYAVSFEDTDGTPLGTYFVFAGGSLISLPKEIAQWVDVQKRPALDGWLPRDGARGDYPAKLQEPIVLRPAYKKMHEVRFYITPKDQAPHALQQVVQGQTIDWTAVPDPAPEDARFGGWAFYDPWVGASGEVPVDFAVHAPTTLVAMLEPLYLIRFLDGAGDTIAQRRAALGESVDLGAVAAPPRPGLAFSHWVDADGYPFTAERQVVSDMALRPVYLATVTFMDGDRVHATRTVPLGEVLYDLPDAPEREGHWFDGWDRDMALPVDRSITVSPVFQAFPQDPVTDVGADGQGAGDWQEEAGGEEPEPPAAAYEHWTDEGESVLETPIDLYDAVHEDNPMGILIDEALAEADAWMPDVLGPDAAPDGRFQLSPRDVPGPGRVSATLADCIE